MWKKCNLFYAQDNYLFFLQNKNFPSLEHFGTSLAIPYNKLYEQQLIVANVYVPCDPTCGVDFLEMVYDKLYEIMDKHEDVFLIIGGDFNACMNPDQDSLNRTKTVNEVRLTDYISTNNNTSEIPDSHDIKNG